jgi:hypothetical protein
MRRPIGRSYGKKFLRYCEELILSLILSIETMGTTICRGLYWTITWLSSLRVATLLYLPLDGYYDLAEVYSQVVTT